MEEIINEALISGILIPIVAGLIVIGALRFGLGGTRGPASAGAAIAIAFMIGYTLTLTWPDFPPRTSGQKVAYVALFGTVIGLAADLLGLTSRLRWIFVIVAPGAIVAWLGWRVVGSLEFSRLGPHALLWIAGMFAFARLSADHQSRSTPVVLMLAFVISAAAIAFLGASGSLAQLFGTAAAGIGAFLLWNWPTARFPLGSAGLLGGGGILVALSGSMILFSDASFLASAFLLLIFLAPSVASRLPFKDNRALAPIVLGLAAAVVFSIGSSDAVHAADTYAIDKPHTQIKFSVSRGGWTNMAGWFEKFDGTIKFDEADVTKSSVEATIDTGSINTGFKRRDAHLASPDFFNAKEIPTMTFKSTKVEKTGDKTGKVTGDFTMLGVTKQVVLDVTFNRKAAHPRNKKTFTGFSAVGKIKRSDFGMKYGLGGIGDEVTIEIEALAVLK